MIGRESTGKVSLPWTKPTADPLMIDSDNTGERATAYISFIEIFR